MIRPQQTTTSDHRISLQEARELRFFECNLGLPSREILGAFPVMYLNRILLVSGQPIQSVGCISGAMNAMAEVSKPIGAMLKVGTTSRTTDIQDISNFLNDVFGNAES